VSLDTAVLQSDTIAGELDLIVRQHARLVYRVCYSVLRHHHDAEDATQETFLRVWRHRAKIAHVRELRTWLACIAWRVAVERRKRLPEVELDETNDAVDRLRSSMSSADQIFLGAEMQHILDRLVMALSSKLRDPLILSSVEELSPAEIGKVLRTNEAAVRSRLFRARQILHGKLASLLDGKHGL
jgi:RNA polymerase sigma-70 factor, ECF subfamily